MKILFRNPDKKYSIQRYGKNLYSVVKILKDYNDERKAIDDLSKLLVGEIIEQDLINSNKDMNI